MKFEINNNVVNEYIINKSRFICLLYKIYNVDDINNIINDVKKEYKGATHYCYSYIVDNKEKCSDDGEPGGTAGLPILNVLKKNNLTNILCIVVRYFGGIKLGAGGLVRAYSTSVTEALKLVCINEYVKFETIEVITNYENIKDLEYLLKDYEILDKTFSENIHFIVKIPVDKIESITNHLKQKYIVKRGL
ncbi:MAG: YigZ family protein [Firmicutes bacterium]|nr:YigZ family protein [Bacillota bacterium]